MVDVYSVDAPELPPLLSRITCEGAFMIVFLLWCILFVLCWPIAVLALLLYPLVWLVLLPFRILGFAVSGILEIAWAVVLLPFRLLRAPFRLV